MMMLPMLACLLFTGSNVHADVVVRPEYQHFKSPNSGVTKCVFPTPLTECWIRLSEHWGNQFDRVLDFRAGVNSQRVNLNEKYRRFDASYAGEGLDSQRGECGVRVDATSYSILLVECYGRTEDGQVGRGWGIFTTDVLKVLPVTPLTPRVLVAPQGANVSVLVRTDRKVTGCTIKTPSAGRVDLSPGETIPPNSRYQHYGDGPDNKECGFTLPFLRANDAGVWWTSVVEYSSLPWLGAYQVTVVLVQAAPEGQPYLEVLGSDLAGLEVGDTLVANCWTPASVPPCNVTWILGGKVVKQDQLNNTLPGDLGRSLPWQPQPVNQTLRHRMTAGDFGQRLECRMEHPALTAPRTVYYKLPALPKPTAGSSSKLCPTLKNSTVSVSCSLGATNVDCVTAPARLGTRARLECRDGFKPQGEHPGSLVTTCTGRSRWRPTPFNCDLDCGLRRGDSTPLSFGGKEARAAEFPWQVAIFRKDGSSYQPICGGSLISHKHFITAAHCFWNHSTGKPQDKTLYKVSLGKHSLLWETRDATEQRRDVKELHIHDNFDGHNKHYESDVAVVELSAPIEVTQAVNVVCVDWSNTFEYQQLAAGVLGTVPGWGIDESNRQSATLRFVDLPFVSNAECRASVPWDFKNFLVLDKVCGGYTNRSTSVCPGDSGGGFVFPTPRPVGVRYYLRAVVSTSARIEPGSSRRCQYQHRTAFIKLSVYSDWIKVDPELLETNVDGFVVALVVSPNLSRRPNGPNSSLVSCSMAAPK